MVSVQEQYALLFFGKERAPSESVLGVRAVPLFTELPRETVRKGVRGTSEASILVVFTSEIELLGPVSSVFEA